LNPRNAQPDVLSKSGPTVGERYAHDLGEESQPVLVDGEPSLAAELLLGVWRERRFVAKAFAIGLLVAAIISLLIPPKYESTTRIMPPEKQGLAGLAAMLAAAGTDKAGSLVGGMVSDAVGVKSSGALYIGVLKSSTVQNTLVEHFDLRKVYHVRYEKDAREVLSDNTDINEDRKSGIVSITVIDRSQQRAMQMARAYIDALNGLTSELNTSAAHRERLFIEDRLKTVKRELDGASKELSEFSTKNLTLDVKEQGKAMVEGAAELTGELIAAESQLSGLEQIYTANNVRVRSLQARVTQLKNKLSELRGTQADATDPNADTGGDFGISIAKLPALGVSYYDLYRRVKIQETVFEILTKQYELAKVEEAKELPTIKVLDEATLPETKSSPKRRDITLLGGTLAATLAVAYIMIFVRMRTLSISHPLSLLGFAMREGFTKDWEFFRSHFPNSVVRVFTWVWAQLSLRR